MRSGPRKQTLGDELCSQSGYLSDPLSGKERNSENVSIDRLGHMDPKSGKFLIAEYTVAAFGLPRCFKRYHRRKGNASLTREPVKERPRLCEGMNAL